MPLVYTPASVTATTPDTAQAIFPLAGEKGNYSIIDIYNSGTVDVYVNLNGVHDANSWFPIAGGASKQFQAKGKAGVGALEVSAYVLSSSATVYVIPMAP